MNLFIGNVSPETTESSLETLFSEFGEIVSIKIPTDPATGMPRGFAFVEMADKFESFDAIDNIDQTYFEGQIITVKESKPKNQQGNRGGGNRRFSNSGGGNRFGGGGNRFDRGEVNGNRFGGNDSNTPQRPRRRRIDRNSGGGFNQQD